MRFYPSDEPVPERLTTRRFLLRPLRTGDVALDYEAVMESAALLHVFGGGSWPADDFTMEDNLADLARHQREHEAGEAFTYTVMNLHETSCLGCVYIDPLARLLNRGKHTDLAPYEPVSDFSAVVRYWARQSQMASGLDRRLFAALLAWLRQDWAFAQVYFQANEHDAKQVETLVDAGLLHRFTVHVPGVHGPIRVFGPA